jgi:hypothetical protein
LVHCRLCHFRVSDDNQYDIHLFQKHSVTNVSSKTEKVLWAHEYDGSPKFFCALCSKVNNLSINFFNHYMGYHHFTLKCFSSIISGTDIPFTVDGADVSSQFIDIELKKQIKCGYTDLEKSLENRIAESHDSDNTDSNNIMNVFIPEIKQEIASETEDIKEQSEEVVEEHKEKTKTVKNTIIHTYEGNEDFDVTLMELIILQKCYFNYMQHAINQINLSILPEESTIDYECTKNDVMMELLCSLCNTKLESIQGFSAHMGKMHSVKAMPSFSCRICATTFDSLQELEVHATEEMKDFDDLWMCQFCEKEFDNREATRRHMNEHWSELEFDNCFSPHLGFKCKHCPTLFWNETDRRTHQIRVHFSKHKEDYYMCESCSEVFNDKVFIFILYLTNNIVSKAQSFLAIPPLPFVSSNGGLLSFLV